MPDTIIADDVRAIAQDLAAKDGVPADATFKTEADAVVSIPTWILYVRDAEKALSANFGSLR